MVSIIIVNFHSQAQTTKLKSSLSKSKYSDFEMIVVDNTRHNIGYGAGVNLGAAMARGKYLLVINPDTEVFPDTIGWLVDFLDANPKAAIVAPLLVDSSGRPLLTVGSADLTPLRGMVAHSFVNKIWPTNPISQNYWIRGDHLSSPTLVGVVPGTCFLIRKSVFQAVGGFDPRFFLYFEESDLCRRVRQAGHDIYLQPASRLVHYWAQSTPQTSRIKQIFARSRFRFFYKHFGLIKALIVELFCRANLPSLALLLIFSTGIFLRTYHIYPLMTFIGDQAWFYLSARDALLTGQFPIAGITSSITWLNQGPLWTYLLIPALFFSGFNPISGAVISIAFGIASMLLLHVLARRWFGATAAMFAVAIFSVLPSVVINARMPYHTSLIPFFSLIFIACLYLKRYFTAMLFLGFLYQSHLLTFIFWPLAVWYIRAPKLRYLLGFALGILPFIISGPVQVFGIFKWLAYHLLRGFSGITFYSEAYTALFFVPIALFFGLLLSRLPSKIALTTLVIFIWLCLSRPLFLYGPELDSRIQVARSILRSSQTANPQISIQTKGPVFSSSRMPYSYLVWWQAKSYPPSGNHTVFEVDDDAQSVRVLE